MILKMNREYSLKTDKLGLEGFSLYSSSKRKNPKLPPFHT